MTKLLTNEELYHFGTLGMKWGIRKYQYEDGTLTPEGIERYRKGKKKLETLEKAKERHDTRAAKADYIRATTRSVNKAVRKDRVQAKEHLRSITTENKIKKTIKKLESSLGMSIDDLERNYGKNASFDADKNKRLVDDLIDRYFDTCAGEDRSYGMECAKEELERLFPKSKESIDKVFEDDKENTRGSK